MENNNQKRNVKEPFEIDYLHILQMLWHRIWAIILCAVIGAGIAFSYAYFYLKPWYNSSILLYVNTNTVSVGGQNVKLSSYSLNGGESLISTYIAILKNRTTLEMIAEETELDVTYPYLMGAISASPVDDTAVFEVKVTTDDPQKSSIIANSIAKVLPLRIDEIIEGSSMKVVDKAIPATFRAGPSFTNYCLKGFAIGAAFAIVIIAVFALLDDVVHDEEFLTTEFDIPIFARVPNLSPGGLGRHGYYKKSGYYGKGGYGSYGKYGRYGRNKSRIEAPPEGEARANLDSEIEIRAHKSDNTDKGGDL